MKNKDGDKNVFPSPECKTSSGMLAALCCQGSHGFGEEEEEK